MDLKKYMTFTVKWEKFLGEDEDTHMASYAEPVDIKCFIYGKNIFIREEDGATAVSAKVYLTLADVQVKDKVDGQVVKSVNSNPESWDSRVQLYEVLTWNT